MNEVFTIADESPVPRRPVGRTDRAADFDQNKLISLMVGRELTQMFPKGEAEIEEEALAVRDLALEGVFKGVHSTSAGARSWVSRGWSARAGPTWRKRCSG